MTRIEFASVMAYVTAAVQKPLPAESAEVYFDLLGDLSKDVLLTAAKRVLLAHRWMSFPTVAELRESVVDTLRGQVLDLSAAEAWKLAWRAAGSIDPEQDGSVKRHCADLPPLVVEAMDAFGIVALCVSKDPVSVMRAQFVKIYEQLQTRERRAALLPASVRLAVERIGREQELPAPAAKAVRLIGNIPGEPQCYPSPSR